jgi:hypothetical protein
MAEIPYLWDDFEDSIVTPEEIEEMKQKKAAERNERKEKSEAEKKEFISEAPSYSIERKSRPGKINYITWFYTWKYMERTDTYYLLYKKWVNSAGKPHSYEILCVSPNHRTEDRKLYGELQFNTFEKYKMYYISQVKIYGSVPGVEEALKRCLQELTKGMKDVSKKRPRPNVYD